MNGFIRKLITEWRILELPFEDAKFLVAVSGGADSCALAFGLHELVRLKKITNKFVIGHFNHRLRGIEAEKDSGFVKNFANEMGFEFIGGAAVKVSNGSNIEETARKARYKFLFETAATMGCYAVLTGHTKNDQAETFLLNLIRGSGIEGLSGMEAKRLIGTSEFFDSSDIDKQIPFLIRPMLNWAFTSDTENYAADNGIAYREDSMNKDPKFSRVEIRNKILPKLEELNPKIVDTIARTASVLRDDTKVLAELETVDEKLWKSDLHLPVLKLLSLTPERARRTLRNWLKDKRGSLRGLDHKHIDAIYSLAKSRKSGRIVQIPNSDSILKRDGMLIFQQTKVEK